MNRHRIERFEDIEIFLQRIENIEYSRIECTSHTLFRLSEKQRKIFTCEELKQRLKFGTPLKVGVQYNGNYAIYYKHKEKALATKIIIRFAPASINIVTFYNIHINQIPK